jgi:hypothetical protein
MNVETAMFIPYLPLPFAGRSPDRKTVFLDDMELAAVICAAQAGRKRSAVSEDSKDVVFVSQFHYPLWAIPWGKSCILLDGMKTVEGSILLLEAPDPETLVDNLKRNAKDQEQFLNALRSESETFKAFSSRKQISIPGYIADRQILIDMVSFLKDTAAIADVSESLSESFVQPKIDKETAIRTTNELLTHYAKLQSEIKGLRYAIEVITQETQVHASKLQQELQEMQEAFNQRRADLSRIVSEKTAALEDERNSEIERMKTRTKGKLDDLFGQKRELEKQLLSLEQDKSEYAKRRDLRKSKKDKLGEARWKVRQEHVEKQISQVKGKAKTLSRLVTRIQEENEKEEKKISSSYSRLVNEEKMKIVDFEKSRDLKLEEKAEETKELQGDTLVLNSNIEALIQQIQLASSGIEEARILWETETPTLIGIPSYVVRYPIGSESTYLLFPPVTVNEYKGLMMKIGVSLGVSGLGSRIGSLLKPRFKSFERLFNSFRKELEKDKDLEANVNQIGMSNNLLSRVDLEEKLGNGLEALEGEGWIKPEEREAILSAYRKN